MSTTTATQTTTQTYATLAQDPAWIAMLATRKAEWAEMRARHAAAWKR